MTNEEARERFKWHKTYLADESWKECFQKAIEALEKQIPIKPQTLESFKSFHRCAACKGSVSQRLGHNYCPFCGRLIDWSAEND